MAHAGTRIAVVGLGYVGLPLAIALARSYRVVGLDINNTRTEELKQGFDRTGEIDREPLLASGVTITSDPEGCRSADVYIVTVPTPVDEAKRPDLGPVVRATEMLAPLLSANKRSIVVYESTVYPGVTEEVCGPIIERVTGLRRGRDFFLGYSPERINPGDREHSVDRIVKVVAGENSEITEELCEIYGRVTTGGTFACPDIRTAEAAKVIENAQRDINIAFMNEIAQIFAKMGISTVDVLEAAGTKWNFLNFRPGLVGGHCIGVDPYYLSHCAQSLGHLPRMILAGRSINDGMAIWVADSIHSRRASRSGRVLILGATFKEDVPDLRNSKVIELMARLKWLGHDIAVHDPVANADDVLNEFGIALTGDALSRRYDVVLGAVAHRHYRDLNAGTLSGLLERGGLAADLHGMWRRHRLRDDIARWTF